MLADPDSPPSGPDGPSDPPAVVRQLRPGATGWPGWERHRRRTGEVRRRGRAGALCARRRPGCRFQRLFDEAAQGFPGRAGVEFFDQGVAGAAAPVRPPPGCRALPGRGRCGRWRRSGRPACPRRLRPLPTTARPRSPGPTRRGGSRRRWRPRCPGIPGSAPSRRPRHRRRRSNTSGAGPGVVDDALREEARERDRIMPSNSFARVSASVFRSLWRSTPQFPSWSLRGSSRCCKCRRPRL